MSHHTRPAPVDDAPPLAGKVAVVTGASSGLGMHFARTLVGLGARIVVTARRSDRLMALASDLGKERVCVVPGNLTEQDFPRRLMEEAAEAYDGSVGVLVNSAGVSFIGRAEVESDSQFSAVLALNLSAVFACCREAHTVMRTGGGSIVNVASALGLVGIGRIPQASYCAAKGGVVNLTRELAAQWADDGIRINCIAPGWFPSEMTEKMLSDERSLRYIERTVPMRRPGRVEELDGVLRFLATDASSYVTGQTIAVDGGWTAV